MAVDTNGHCGNGLQSQVKVAHQHGSTYKTATLTDFVAFVACVQVQGHRGYVLIFGGLTVSSSDMIKTKFLRPRPPAVNKGTWRI